MADEPVTKVTVADQEGFPTAAIIVLAVGGYLILFFIVLTIRKLCLSKGNNSCPWCLEICLCTSCCVTENNEDSCAAFCYEWCNCLTYPNKRDCMDAVCPTKQKCDEICCCCCSSKPEGAVICCSGQQCSEQTCCACNDCCKDCCDMCKSDCCNQPETVSCCCIEIKLSSASQRGRAMGNNSMQDGYNNGYTNQGYGNPGMINQQPGGYNQHSFQSGYNQSGHNQPQHGINQPQHGINQPQHGINQQPSFSGDNPQAGSSRGFSSQPGANFSSSSQPSQKQPISAQRQNMFLSREQNPIPMLSEPAEQITKTWTRGRFDP